MHTITIRGFNRTLLVVISNQLSNLTRSEVIRGNLFVVIQLTIKKFLRPTRFLILIIRYHRIRSHGIVT